MAPPANDKTETPRKWRIGTDCPDRIQQCVAMASSEEIQEICDFKKDKALLETAEKPGDGHIRQRSPDGAWAWVVCMSGVISTMIVFGLSYSFGLLFPVLLDEFKESKAKTAWVGSLAISCSGLFAPIAGKLCECLGPRLVVVCGTLLCVASLFLTSQVSSISWMCLTYGVLFGMGSCAIYMSTFLEVPKHFIKRKSLATGMIAMGPGGGMLIMSPVMQVLLDVLHWRYALMVLAGVVSLCCIVGCAYDKRLLTNNYNDVPAPADLMKDSESSTKIGIKGLSFLRNPLYLSLTMIVVVAFFGHTVPLIHLIRYSEDLGITADLASRFYLCTGLGSQLARLVTGRLCDFNWFNPRMFLHMGLALSGVSTLLLPHLTRYSLLLLYSIVYGIADGLLCCGCILSIIACLRETEAPIGFGLFQFFACLAFAAGPPLGGLIADSYGSYTSAFYVAGSLGIFSTIAVFFTYCLKPMEKTLHVESTETSYELLVVTNRVSVL